MYVHVCRNQVSGDKIDADHPGAGEAAAEQAAAEQAAAEAAEAAAAGDIEPPPSPSLSDCDELHRFFEKAMSI